MSAMRNLWKWQLWEKITRERWAAVATHSAHDRAFVLQSELLNQTSERASQQHQQQLWLSVVQKVE